MWPFFLEFLGSLLPSYSCIVRDYGHYSFSPLLGKFPGQPNVGVASCCFRLRVIVEQFSFYYQRKILRRGREREREPVSNLMFLNCAKMTKALLTPHMTASLCIKVVQSSVQLTVTLMTHGTTSFDVRNKGLSDSSNNVRQRQQFF